MPLISRIISIFLRVGELAFAAVAAGLIGNYLDSNPPTHPTRVYARFIYTVIVAGVSILLSLLNLIPFSHTFTSYPIDFLLSLGWFASFGLLVNYINNAASGCHGSGAFHWGGLTKGGVCNRFRTAQAFSFLSAVFWLVSAVVGFWFIQSERKKVRDGAATTGAMRSEEVGNAAPVKKSWYRRDQV